METNKISVYQRIISEHLSDSGYEVEPDSFSAIFGCVTPISLGWSTSKTNALYEEIIECVVPTERQDHTRELLGEHTTFNQLEQITLRGGLH